MNRLLVIIGIIMMGSNAISQPYGGLLSGIRQHPAYEFQGEVFSVKNEDGRYVYNLTPQKFKALLGSQNMLKKLEKETYSFFQDGKFYMLSYDTCKNCNNNNWRDNMRIERSLFLFRLDDSGWVRASDKPLQIDFTELRDSKWYYSAYFPWKYDINFEMIGKVEKLPTGEIHFKIINHKMDDFGSTNSHIKFFYNEVILTSKDDGTYWVQ